MFIWVQRSVLRACFLQGTGDLMIPSVNAVQTTRTEMIFLSFLLQQRFTDPRRDP